jgi:hypothetical protein
VWTDVGESERMGVGLVADAEEFVEWGGWEVRSEVVVGDWKGEGGKEGAWVDHVGVRGERGCFLMGKGLEVPRIVTL